MKLKTGFVALLISLAMPLALLAQSSGGAAKSIESLNFNDIAEDSVIVLSQDESGISGSFQIEYAYVDSACADGVQLVRYNGPTVNTGDRALRMSERKLCSDRVYDSGGDD